MLLLRNRHCTARPQPPAVEVLNILFGFGVEEFYFCVNFKGLTIHMLKIKAL